MPEALEVIESIIAQHSKVTDDLNQTGKKANDVAAIFGVQKAAVKVVWSATSAKKLLEKRDELQEIVGVLEDGLRKHFTYEEKVMPLIMGELTLKGILDAHSEIYKKIENIKTLLAGLEGDDQEALTAAQSELIQGINDLSETVKNHAKSEETTLNMLKQVFE
jgi:hemerythrin